MSVAKTLSVQSFRSHQQKTINFHPNTTIIIGKNGSGKTSLLEALYISLQGRSFKGNEEDILKKGDVWWRADTVLFDGTKQSVSFTTELNSSNRNFIINDKKTKRLPTKNRCPIVLFEPNDLLLLHGPPSKRRDHIDNIISQIDIQYRTILLRYEKALKQRNSLLKQGVEDRSRYFPWEVVISEYGASIITRRERLIDKINKEITKKYQKIAKNKDNITIEAQFSSKKDTTDKLLKEMEENFHKDLLIKHTTKGPHRHDINFLVNNSPASTTASRGEVRTIVLSLKFLEAEIIEEITNKKPIILLDDVFSELDEQRQKNILQSPYQTIITTTAVTDENIDNAKIIKIR